jgi:hypothetical protein
VDRINNLCLDVIEKLFCANGVSVVGDKKAEAHEKRLKYQSEAMQALDLIDYLAQLSFEQGCILFKQFEQIGKGAVECKRLLGAWINSDKRRFGA